jgi:asparagine synthase (glutamine-hydrolysing)
LNTQTAQPVPKTFTGDILVSFDTQPTRLPARFAAAPWALKETMQGSQVWSCPVSPNWKGFPFLEDENETWKIYLLGEISSGWSPHGLEKNIGALNGQFLIVAFDKAERRWHVWTDRFGTLHIYYSPRSIGTFSPAVATSSHRKLDWCGLAGFFSFGFFLQDRTHYQDVAIIPPASHYVFDERGAVVFKETYWQWQHIPNTSRSYQETIQEFASIFAEVLIEAFEDGKVAIPLSGGLDSRSSVVPVPKKPRNTWAYSYGYSDDSVETHIARQVAAARQIPFRSFTIRPYLFENLERILGWTEGFQDITQPRQAFVRDEIAACSDILIAALWGDVWFDQMGLAAYSADSLSTEQIAKHTSKKIKKDGRAWLIEHLVQPQLGREDVESLTASFVGDALHPLEYISDPDFRVKAFKTANWSFRWSLSPIRVFQSAARPRLIFYDHRITDFFGTVPTQYLIGRKLQVDYLKCVSPDLARITWQAYDANLYQYQGFNTWLVPKRTLKKIGRSVWGKPVLQRNWEVQFLNTSGRQGLEALLLRSALRLHEFVPPAEIRLLLDSFYARPDASQGYTVCMLLTFSAWLEKYGS